MPQLIPLEGNLRILSATKRYEQSNVKMDVAFEFVVNNNLLSHLYRTWDVLSTDEPFEKAQELILAELAVSLNKPLYLHTINFITMVHEVEKTAIEWAKLYLEYKILHSGATDMLLQFICDLNARKVSGIAEAFLEKRKELIKKHGTAKENDSFVVEEFLTKTKKKAGEDVTEKVQNPAFEAYTKEITDIANHKTSIKIDLIELSLLKGQNPRDFSGLFNQVGVELAVYNFSEIYTVTDRLLESAAQKG